CVCGKKIGPDPRNFNQRVSLGRNDLLIRTFLKQLAMIFMSILAGNMYESIGFQGAYLVLGLVALGFTLISVFTLSGPGPLSLLRRQVNEVS
ncbi:MFS transporter, partial [Serratia sp. IR-2025]